MENHEFTRRSKGSQRFLGNLLEQMIQRKSVLTMHGRTKRSVLMHPLATAVLVVAVQLPFAAHLAAQAGCTGLPCTNPVPCYNCVGSWNDGTGVTWSLTSDSSYNVSGTAVLAPVVPGCPSVTYSTVSGSISQGFRQDGTQGYTSFTWTARNPSPSGSCGGYTPATYITDSGSIQNNGCDKGSGTWTDSYGGGSFVMSKPPNVPTSEITTPVGFSTGIYATVGQFRQTLQGPTWPYGYDGRQVSEASNGTPADSCYFPGSIVPPYALSGGVWNVDYYYSSNVWADDYVGWPTGAVTYYRQNFRPPCSGSAPQGMYIAIGGTSGSRQLYSAGSVGATIPDYAQVTVTRNGQNQSTVWP